MRKTLITLLIATVLSVYTTGVQAAAVDMVTVDT